MKKLLLILVTVALVVIPINALSVPGTTKTVEPEVVSTTTVEPVEAEEKAPIIQESTAIIEPTIQEPAEYEVEENVEDFTLTEIEPIEACGCDHTELYSAIDEIRDRLLELELYGYVIDPNIE